MRTTVILGGAAAAAIALVACSANNPEPAAPVQPAPRTQRVATAAVEPAATAAPSAPATPAAPQKRAKLRLEVEGEDIGAPLVDVVVGGQPTSLIVDTGATHHVVASWVAAQVGPTTAAPSSGLDHAGRTVALTQLEGVDIRVSGWGNLGAAGTLVASLPQPLRKQGIGGVLSPQSLASEGRAVVLDLRKGTMTEAALDDALKALEAEPGAALSGEMRSCNNGGALSFVRATIGGVEVEAQLDTGATSTTVRAAAAVGVHLKPLAKGTTSAYAASGLFTVPSAEGTHVKLGALDVETNVDLVKRDARPLCANDAFIGMDVLRRCTIVLGTTTVAAKCSSPR